MSAKKRKVGDGVLEALETARAELEERETHLERAKRVDSQSGGVGVLEGASGGLRSREVAGWAALACMRVYCIVYAPAAGYSVA